MDLASLQAAGLTFYPATVPGNFELDLWANGVIEGRTDPLRECPRLVWAPLLGGSTRRPGGHPDFQARFESNGWGESRYEIEMEGRCSDSTFGARQRLLFRWVGSVAALPLPASGGPGEGALAGRDSSGPAAQRRRTLIPLASAPGEEPWKRVGVIPVASA